MAASTSIFKTGQNLMDGGLAIFVKTPGVSPLKTRLAAGMGNDSQRWYGLAVDAVKSVALQAQKNCSINVYWAVAENDAMQNPLWQSLPRLAQAEDRQSDLGERMGRVMRMLIRQHGFGLLVGADAPQICANDIETAADYLNHEQARMVLGPARDGGFWCVGSNRKLSIELWQSVTYSLANTYRDFVLAFSPHAEILTLRTLSDVDEVADLSWCHQELNCLEATTAEQNILLAAFNRSELTT
jgi:glycosyltransferase A (GT-A) superfamily protein (DUF2064 family)